MNENLEFNHNRKDEDPWGIITEQTPQAHMASLSLGLGIASLTLFMTGFLSIILGGVGVVIGILSGNKRTGLPKYAKRGIIFASVGIIASYLMLATNVYTVLTNPDMRQQLNEVSQQMNGVTFDETLQELQQSFGVSMD